MASPSPYHLESSYFKKEKAPSNSEGIRTSLSSLNLSPVDIDGIREPLSGSLLYGKNHPIIQGTSKIGRFVKGKPRLALLPETSDMGREWELSFRLGSFSDGMPLGISGTFNFMIVFHAEHNILMHPFHRESTENESANSGYRFGQEEETENIIAAHGIWFTVKVEIPNRANLGMEVMHERNAHNFL
ncbi:Photosystem Q(B) protein [Cucumis melo var. makuwa]|uniref:Photosystem Q(B) protein n=1 Tax=Cucumis melo var. makuwa TaxID=1194695 RepID=A0A5A7SWV5_CUCMM|nr:Photosystem Q(B) protein [Cucumis melo var. makuwa]TYK22944.1 Photosystem Q(B) protein [Cucumis melo var. makuwa]